jgi:3-oxoacyl-[acyl-carrier protein] reductase
MKTAIVTGGSRGIGNAIVRALAARGVDTVFTYKSGEEEALALQHELNSQGFQVLATRLDITDSEACRKFINDLYREKGVLDILINNAGVTQDSFSLP